MVPTGDGKIVGAFIEALVGFLRADKAGNVTPGHKSRLVAARTQAKKSLNARSFNKAVIRAFRMAGFQ